MERKTEIEIEMAIVSLDLKGQALITVMETILTNDAKKWKAPDILNKAH